MQTAEVVIIGGGIVGSSIAYHLAAAGCTDILVIERETAQGKGSTCKSMGGVRAQFSTPVNIQMSLYSIPFYADFDERLGHPAGYRPQGYLFCATHEKHLAYLRTNYLKQVAMGLKEVQLITADEIRNRFPQLRAYKEKLYELGATWAAMSGSGSTIVGAFPDVSSRDAARSAFPGVRTETAEVLGGESRDASRSRATRE